MRVPDSTKDTAATIIPSVGCPLGCNFCTTSSFFGGKGKSVNFYESGDELFELMEHMEHSMHVNSFFMMDENFLLNRPRAMQLLERMKKAGKSWALYVFSSVNAIRKYTMEELVQLGVSWIWVGLESPNSTYAKLKNSDTHNWLRSCAGTASSCWDRPSSDLSITRRRTSARRSSTRLSTTRTFTSSCSIRRCRARRCSSRWKRKSGCSTLDLADIHGQFKFNFKHAAISRDDSQRFLDWAFRFDFEKNGPSLYRICETMFKGWKRYKNYPDLRVRERFMVEGRKLKGTYNASLWAMEQRLKTTNATVAAKIGKLRREIESEFGVMARLSVRSPVRCCCGHRSGKRSGLPEA